MPRVRDRLHAALRHRAMPVAALAAIYGVSVLVYSWVASKHTLSDVFPDEVFYAKLSQAFADGHGLTWRGTDWGLPPLWPVVLSLGWHVGSSVPDGYAAAKVLGAMLASTAVIPVWLLGRELVGPRRALLAAALSVAGAWMVVTSYLVSENLAYPLATASFACIVMALRRPQQLRWIVASLAFAVVGAAARTELLALPVILVVALVVDVARQPAGDRRARISARPRALWIGLVVAVAVLLLAFVVNPRLTNYDVLATHVSLAKAAKTAGQHFATSFVLFAGIPVAAVIALMTRGSNWRDDVVGPLLATIVAGIVVLFPLLGRFEAYATAGRPVDRYAMYLAPLFMIGLVVAVGRIGRRGALAAATVVSGVLLLVPASQNYIEQPALYGAQARVEALGGFFADHVRLGLVLIGIPLIALGTLALTGRRRHAIGLGAAVAIVLALMVAQTWTSQSKEIDLIAKFRNEVAPAQLDWVDRKVDGPVAVLDLGKPQSFRGNRDLYTEFFNRNIRDMYATVPAGGGECRVKLGLDGRLDAPSGHCQNWPRYYVIQVGPLKTTLHDQQVLATTAHHGTLVRTPGGQPRVLALVKPPCSGISCTGRLEVGLYLDTPGSVTATFASPKRLHILTLGKTTEVLAPDEKGNVTFPVEAGSRGYTLPLDWTDPTDGPALESVTLRSGGKTTRIW